MESSPPLQSIRAVGLTDSFDVTQHAESSRLATADRESLARADIGRADEGRRPAQPMLARPRSPYTGGVTARPALDPPAVCEQCTLPPRQTSALYKRCASCAACGDRSRHPSDGAARGVCPPD